MGAAGGASIASIASLGLSAIGDVSAASGKQSSYEFQADKAERAAQFGRIQAHLTDTVMTEQLNTTLSNIDVIRSAGHIDPTSPTTMAVEDRNRLVSDRQRTAALASIQSQVSEDEASAKYLREAGDYALRMGYLKAGVDVAGGLAKAFTSGGGG